MPVAPDFESLTVGQLRTRRKTLRRKVLRLKVDAVEQKRLLDEILVLYPHRKGKIPPAPGLVAAFELLTAQHPVCKNCGHRHPAHY